MCQRMGPFATAAAAAPLGPAPLPLSAEEEEEEKGVRSRPVPRQSAPRSLLHRKGVGSPFPPRPAPARRALAQAVITLVFIAFASLRAAGGQSVSPFGLGQARAGDPALAGPPAAALQLRPHLALLWLGAERRTSGQR